MSVAVMVVTTDKSTVEKLAELSGAMLAVSRAALMAGLKGALWAV